MHSVIEPVSDGLPERVLEARHREETVPIRMKQGQILLQAATHALLRSQVCLVQSRTETIIQLAEQHRDTKR